MYFVDRKKINTILELIENYTRVMEELPIEKSQYEKLAVERMVYVIVEGILDVGNAMIDGFIMRDPGSYEDIIDILVDEKVVTAQNGQQLKNIISLRKTLVQEYMNIDFLMMERIITENMTALQDFPENVNEYLKKELGPVSAFIPKQN